MSEFKVGIKHGVAVCTIGDTLLSVWQAQLTKESWAWFWSEVTRLTRTYSDGILILGVVLPTSSPPSAETIGQIQSDFRSLAKMRMFVTVPVGDDFWQSVVRAIVRTTFVVLRQSHRIGVADNVDEGLAKLLQHGSSQTPTITTMRRCIEQMYEQLGALNLERGS